MGQGFHFLNSNLAPNRDKIRLYNITKDFDNLKYLETYSIYSRVDSHDFYEFVWHFYEYESSQNNLSIFFAVFGQYFDLMMKLNMFTSLKVPSIIVSFAHLHFYNWLTYLPCLPILPNRPCHKFYFIRIEIHVKEYCRILWFHFY